jgi:DNA polymerase III subunit gamma/tau
LDESISKKFAYTPQEKFNKLKEKNPLIEKLRQTFELDL